MPGIVDLTSDSFHERVMHSDEPAVVEFFSHSCPHCIKFAPVYKQLSETLSSEAKFFRVDVTLNDQNRELAHARGVRTVPTIEVFYRGRVVENLIGYHHFKKVLDAIRESLIRKEEYVGPGTALEEPRRKEVREGEVKLSLKNLLIRWSKKAKVMSKDKRIIMRNLKSMTGTIEDAMSYTKRKALEGVAHEVRFSVTPKVYVVTEYCGNAWHVGLETTTEFVGELMTKNLPFTCLLEESAIETEDIM